jgi:hypothetical protein
MLNLKLQLKFATVATFFLSIYILYIVYDTSDDEVDSLPCGRNDEQTLISFLEIINKKTIKKLSKSSFIKNHGLDKLIKTALS